MYGIDLYISKKIYFLTCLFPKPVELLMFLESFENNNRLHPEVDGSASVVRVDCGEQVEDVAEEDS